MREIVRIIKQGNGIYVCARVRVCVYYCIKVRMLNY